MRYPLTGAVAVLISALCMPALAEEPGDDEDAVVVVTRVAPEYPPKALRRCVEGHVKLRFVIDTEGVPEDITVVSAMPERVFDKAAVAAIAQWRFEPRVLNGMKVKREVTQTLKFEPGCTG